MKRLLFTATLALLMTSSCAAQKPPALALAPPTAKPLHEPTMDELLAARAKLIQRYAGKLARGVSICADEDALNGQSSYLAVYVYPDSVDAFFTDFVNFAADTPSGVIEVDGIPVKAVVMIDIDKGDPIQKGAPNGRNPPTKKA